MYIVHRYVHKQEIENSSGPTKKIRLKHLTTLQGRARASRRRLVLVYYFAMVLTQSDFNAGQWSTQDFSKAQDIALRDACLYRRNVSINHGCHLPTPIHVHISSKNTEVRKFQALKRYGTQISLDMTSEIRSQAKGHSRYGLKFFREGEKLFKGYV